MAPRPGIPRLTAPTVTTRGQVTFRTDVSSHLGVAPGGQLELNPAPDGRVELRTARTSGMIDALLGMLADNTGRPQSWLCRAPLKSSADGPSVRVRPGPTSGVPSPSKRRCRRAGHPGQRAQCHAGPPGRRRGVATLRANGDFADRLIAFDGHALDGSTFVSFDSHAVTPLTQRCLSARPELTTATARYTPHRSPAPSP
jgi:hypothetical protein